MFTYDEEKLRKALDELRIHELREFGDLVGVRSPSSMNFVPLRETIIGIVTGRSGVEAKSGRGRPRKAGGDGARYYELLDACRRQSEAEYFFSAPAQASECREPGPAFEDDSFDAFTPVWPSERLRLERASGSSPALRCVDLLAPVGKGQRAFVAGAPGSGKTSLLAEMANAVCENHPEVQCIYLLLDGRPEEAEELRRSVGADVMASCFDEKVSRHAHTAGLALERAKRIAAKGGHAALFVDDLSKLVAAYFPNGVSGASPEALLAPRRFFSAARCIDGGGSLTLVAAAELGTCAGEAVWEQFRSMGNAEIVLKRSACPPCVPCVDAARSMTRRSEALTTAREREAAQAARRLLSCPDGERTFCRLLSETGTNAALIDALLTETDE